MFSLADVGPEITGTTVRLRINLPGLPPQSQVFVYLIAKADQFDPQVVSTRVALQPDPPADDVWGDGSKGRWSTPPITTLSTGTWLYRFEVVAAALDGSGPGSSLHFGDPCARETDTGIFSTFTLPAQPPPPINHGTFRVPSGEDLVIYELNVAEFGGSFAAVAERIPYLLSLGVNAIELLPINSIAEPNQWGYMPIFYLAPEERFGGAQGLRDLVAACHQAGIAVILDMVYAHTDRMFPYQIGYERSVPFWKNASYSDTTGIHRAPNPLVCAHSNYGRKNDWRMRSTREFFIAVNAFWMEQYGIDGFRYDHVNGYLDRDPIEHDGKIDWYSAENRPTFSALRELTLATYQESKRHARFRDPAGHSRVIQIAEDLNESAYQLSAVASNAVTGCWEKQVTDLVHTMADSGDRIADGLGVEVLMADGRYDRQQVGDTKAVGTEHIPVRPVIYLESHDEDRLFHRMQHPRNDGDGFDYRQGLDGQPWWRLQPYAIALMTAVGTPMLFAGQEFAENTGVPTDGQVRVRGLRPIHFDYFYNPDPERDATSLVLPLCRLYRFLGTLRQALPALRGGRSQAKLEMTSPDILLFRRWAGSQVLIVAINFADGPRTIAIPFGHVGTWTDVLEQCYTTTPLQLSVAAVTDRLQVTVPSHFARIFTLG